MKERGEGGDGLLAGSNGSTGDVDGGDGGVFVLGASGGR